MNIAMVTCAFCEGSGGVQDTDCYSCDGAGAVAAFLDKTGAHAKCARCDGSGKEGDSWCYGCKGGGVAGRLDRMLERAAGRVKLECKK